MTASALLVHLHYQHLVGGNGELVKDKDSTLILLSGDSRGIVVGTQWKYESRKDGSSGGCSVISKRPISATEDISPSVWSTSVYKIHHALLSSSLISGISFSHQSVRKIRPSSCLAHVCTSSA